MNRRPLGPHRRWAAVAVAVVFLLGACSVGERPSLGSVAVRVDDGAAASDTAVDGATTLAAIVGLEVDLYMSSDLADEPTSVPTSLAGDGGAGSTRTAAVVSRADGAVEILTANGARGWAAESAVELVALNTEITVDVSESTITIVRDGVSTTEPAALGADVRSLIGEDLFVAALLSLPSEPATPWGSLLFVLSGSDVDPTNLLRGESVRGFHATQSEISGPDLGIALEAAIFADLANAGLALGTPITIGS